MGLGRVMRCLLEGGGREWKGGEGGYRKEGNGYGGSEPERFEICEHLAEHRGEEIGKEPRFGFLFFGGETCVCWNVPV